MEMEEVSCIIACETLRQELNLVMRNRECALPVYWIDAGRHLWPDKLRISIQDTLDSLEQKCRVLFVFGFCGNAMVGIRAGIHTLVLPRAADCIPLFIGSQKERDAYGAGTYFFTEGYINSGGSIASDSIRIMQRYGKRRGRAILKTMLGHYRDFAVIDTGASNTAYARERAEEIAKLLNIPVKIIPGSLRLIDTLLAGNWPQDDFLIVPPGGSVSFEDSPGMGESLQINTQ